MGINFLSVTIILMIVLDFPAVMFAGDRAANFPSTVDSVDLERYSGLWYEIAKLPNRFQKKCVRNVTASYQLLAKGDIKVINRCERADGRSEEITGIAKVADPPRNSKLRVSFFRPLGISLFWGDYWIIGLGKEYQYAIVGTADRKYGWILSRQPFLEPVQLDEIFEQLQLQGYQPADFEMTPQEY